MSAPPPDRADDCREVSCAAGLLEISEYDLFDAAYRAWYQEAPSAGLIDRHFGPYMFEGVTPFWVRDFARKTLAGARSAVDHSLAWVPGAATVRLGLDLLVARVSRPRRGPRALLRA